MTGRYFVMQNVMFVPFTYGVIRDDFYVDVDIHCLIFFKLDNL